jgi:hypothetical protein
MLPLPQHHLATMRFSSLEIKQMIANNWETTATRSFQKSHTSLRNDCARAGCLAILAKTERNNVIRASPIVAPNGVRNRRWIGRLGEKISKNHHISVENTQNYRYSSKLLKFTDFALIRSNIHRLSN